MEFFIISTNDSLLILTNQFCAEILDQLNSTEYFKRYLIVLYSNGLFRREEYSVNNHFHKKDGPALKMWDEKGGTTEEYHYWHGTEWK